MPEVEFLVFPMAESSSMLNSSPDHKPPEPNSDPGCGDVLSPLLRTLAESLDVREIFARISAEACRIVPHDFLILGLLSEDRQRARLIALSGDLSEGTEDLAVPDQLRLGAEADAYLVNDLRMQAG